MKEKSVKDFKQIYESVLGEHEMFTDLIISELNEQKHIDVISKEPVASNDSQFSITYDDKPETFGTDTEENQSEDGHSFVWRDCEIVWDDDCLYWTSKTGKIGCLGTVAIVNVEANKGELKVTVAPDGNHTKMGVVYFYKKGKRF